MDARYSDKADLARTANACNTGPCVAGEAILVVIPTYNEADHIEACLRSLMIGEDERLGAVTFVVADGGSNDETCAIVAALMNAYDNLKLLHNPARLQSAAVNLVVAQAASDPHSCLVRCDAHAVYPKHYVLDVCDAMRRAGAQSLVTPMDAAGETCFQKANAWIVDTLLGSGGAAHRGGRKSGFVDHGHHAGFDLEAFKQIGGYDPSFSHNEDAEYDWRLSQAGGRIFLDAEIRLTYTPRATPKALARQYFNYGRGRARTLLKHRMVPKWRQMIPVANLLALIGAVVGSPIFPWLLAYPLFYAGALGAASIAVAVRHRSACGLLAGVASAIMHTSWAAGCLTECIASGVRGGRK